MAMKHTIITQWIRVSRARLVLQYLLLGHVKSHIYLARYQPIHVHGRSCIPSMAMMRAQRDGQFNIKTGTPIYLQKINIFIKWHEIAAQTLKHIWAKLFFQQS